MSTIGINFFLQLTGNIFANKYGTVYTKSLGSFDDPFTVTVVNQLINISRVVISMTLVDRIERRSVTLFSISSARDGKLTIEFKTSFAPRLYDSNFGLVNYD